MRLDDLRELIAGKECPNCGDTDKHGMPKKRYIFKRTDLMPPLDRERGTYFDDVRYPSNFNVPELRGKQYPVLLFVSCNFCSTAFPIKRIVRQAVLDRLFMSRKAAA